MSESDAGVSRHSALPKDLDRVLQDASKKLETLFATYDQFSQETNQLWHYTSIDGAHGILSNATLRFTDILHLNDPGETVRGIKIYEEICKRNLSKFSDRPVQALLKPMAESFARAAHEPHRFYVASFSKAEDDLPQWIAYGANATGCAIELSPKAFQSPAITHANGSAPMIFAMSYDESDLREQLEKLVQIAVQSVLKPKGQFANDEIHAFLTDLASQVSLNALLLILGHKSDRYEHEREIRALIIRRRNDETAKHVKTRVSTGPRVVPYLDYDLNLFEGLGLIKLGYRAHELNELGFEELLDSSGLKLRLVDGTTRIVRSKVEYRG